MTSGSQPDTLFRFSPNKQNTSYNYNVLITLNMFKTFMSLVNKKVHATNRLAIRSASVLTTTDG